MAIKPLLAALAAGFLLVGGCTTVETTRPGAVGVDRKQHMLVSEAEVEKGAREAYSQEVGKARSAGTLNADKTLTARVRAISQRLIPATGAFRPDAPRWEWEVNTLQTKMTAANQGGPPEFLSTHPSPASRIQDLQKRVPKVLPLYKRPGS